MRFFTLLLFALLAGTILRAQNTRLIIQFTNKKNTPYSLASPSAYLSAKAIDRRTKQKLTIDSTDLPVDPAYLDSIRKSGDVFILNVSKWFNQVLIQTNDEDALAKIKSFPFVKKATDIAPRLQNAGNAFNEKFKEENVPLPIPPNNNRTTDINDVTELNYGNMYNQVHIHEGEYLHNLGFTGRNIVIAIIDAGFNSYKTNPAFDSVRLQNRVLGEWDFVNNEVSVNEDNVHGANCFSIIASNRPGVLIGSAPHASFWLLRSEAPGEFPVEEQNWAAAAEYADSVGADMISSSLGYIDFDAPFNTDEYNHSYPERDGNTALVTRAADLAAKKGILVVNSAGNSGGQTTDNRFIGCPADGDSVLAVAATDANGNIAGFSSWGPNGTGTQKPNVASVGLATVYAATNGNATAGNGTSYAAPNMCGLIACLWQAFPEFNNMQIIDAVQKSSHLYNIPDYRFGYGIPNFRKAYTILQQLRESQTGANSWIKAYPVPFIGAFEILLKAPSTGKAFFRLTDVLGRTIETKSIETTSGQTYIIDFPRANYLAKGVYYVHYSDGTNKQTVRLIKGK